MKFHALKWPDRPYCSHGGTVLGTDRHGTWLWAPVGSVVTDALRATTSLLPFDFLTLVPSGDCWWIASWMFGWNEIELYVDVVTAVTWTSTGLSAVDLDLDVVRLSDGRVEIWDEDEFAQHQLRYSYPPDVVAAAVTTARRMSERLREAQDPFGGPPERCLTAAHAL